MKQITTTRQHRAGHGNYWIRPLYLLLIGLAFLASGIVLGAMNAKLKGWIVVDGTVGNVTSSQHQGASGDSERRYSYGVTYEVDGKEYRASAISASEVSEGSTKQIAYNPADPNENVIGPAAPWMAPLFIVGGSATLVASALYFFFGRRQVT